MPKGDSFQKNHFVAKGDPDYMIESEDSYQVQFQKLVVINGQRKYARAKVNCGHKQFMEIVEKYGLKLADRWEVWEAGIDGKKGHNTGYSGSD